MSIQHDPIRAFLYNKVVGVCWRLLVPLTVRIRYEDSQQSFAEALEGSIDKMARIIIAYMGGTILVLPLIMMTLFTSVAARLSIACSCVAVFSVLIGFFTKASNQEVLGATAAYTAVLVVFVGASS